MIYNGLEFFIEKNAIISDGIFLVLLVIFLLGSFRKERESSPHLVKNQIGLLWVYFWLEIGCLGLWGLTSSGLSWFIYKHQSIIFLRVCKVIMLLIFISLFYWFQGEQWSMLSAVLKKVEKITGTIRTINKWLSIRVLKINLELNGNSLERLEKIALYKRKVKSERIELERKIEEKGKVSSLSAEGYFIINLSFIALSSLLFAENFLHLYILLELYGITAYTLTGYSNHPKALRASGKYFLLGSLGSFLILLSLVLLYFLYGHLDFQILERSVILETVSGEYSNLRSHSIIIFIFFIGLCLKFGLAPFHTWLIEVYNNTSFFIYVYFLIIPKFFLLIFIIKYLYFVASAAFAVNLSYFLVGLGVVNIVVGTFIPLTKMDLKELLTISSFSNFGYTLLLISSFSYSAGVSGLFAYLIYTGIFLTFVLQIYKSVGSAFFYTEISLYKLKNLPGESQLLLILILLTLSGLPPFALFYGKLLLLIPLLEMKAYLLAIVFIFFSSLSAYYYIRLVHLIFVNSNVLSSKKIRESNIVLLVTVPTLIFVFNYFV